MFQARKEGPSGLSSPADLALAGWGVGHGSSPLLPVLSVSSLVPLLWPAYGNCFYLPSTARMLLHAVLQLTETLDSLQGHFRGCMQSSQLFCRERLGPVTSAWRKCYHLCKQVILVCLPVLWMGNFPHTWSQSVFVIVVLYSNTCQFRGFL